MAGETKKCPFCAEEIKVDAVKCKYCDSILEKTVTSDSASIETKDEKNSVFIKKCPFCAEEINVNDIKCKYCDSNLEKVTTNNSPLSTKKEIKNKKNIPASKGILFILLAFIFLLYLHNKSIIQIPVLTSPYQSEMEEVIKQD